MVTLTCQSCVEVGGHCEYKYPATPSSIVTNIVHEEEDDKLLAHEQAFNLWHHTKL